MTEIPEHLLKRAQAIRDQREREAQLDPVKALREQHARVARLKQAVNPSGDSDASSESVDSNLEKKLLRRSRFSKHPRARIFLVVLDSLFLIGTLVSLFVRSTPAASDEQKTYGFVLTLIVLFALLLASPYFRLRTLDNSSQLLLTNDEKVAIKHFRSARKSLGRMKNKSKSELKQRTKELRDWNDQKGKLIFSVNGVRVFERWLDTPSITGSIMGLSAHVTNFFDVNVEGPPFNGRMIAQGLKKPHHLANKINACAQKATNNESHRQKRLKDLPSEIAALQNDSRVAQADAVFKVASNDLSADIKKSMEQRGKRVSYAVCAVMVVAAVSTFGGVLNAQKSNPMVVAPIASSTSTSSTLVVSTSSTVVDVRSSAWAVLTKSVRSSALSKSKKCGYSGMTVSNAGEYMVYQWADDAWRKARVDTSRWSFTDATNTAALDVTGDNVDDFLLTVPTWDPFSEDQPKAAGVLSQVKCEWTWIPFKATDGRNHYQLDRLRWDSSVNKLVGDDELTNIFADNYDGNRKTKPRYFVYSAAIRSFVRASGAPRVTPSTIALADLPSGSVAEAQFQCGMKLFETLEAYNITNLSPNNIGSVWFKYSDYKFRVGTTPAQIKNGLISVCAEAVKVKLAEVKSAVISSCSWNKARLARAYGVPVSSSKTKVARAIAGDFRKVMQSQVASWCVTYIK
jgi:hypothetical protein